MKRSVKTTVCLLIGLLFLFGAGGCVLPEKPTDFKGDVTALSIGSPYKHYFERLSDTEKQAYNATLSAIFDFPERIEIPALTQEELDEMYTALLYDNPTLFFLTGETTLRQVKKHAYLYPKYRLDASDYEAMQSKCDQIAAQIVSDARAEKATFDRERTVHDRLIATCSYTENATDIYKGTIYGALCGGEAACEGYAKTAKYLLDQLEIPCYVVHGNSTPPGSRTQSHMWNIVQVDGAWYHLDLTWDDPVVEKGGDLIRYTYFNVTDETVRKTHSDFDAGRTCSATDNNFFVHEDLIFTKFGEDEQKRAAAFASQIIALGSDGFQLRFADKDAFSKAQKKLFDDQEIYALLKQIETQTQRKFATDRVSYYTNDDEHAIEILLEQ